MIKFILTSLLIMFVHYFATAQQDTIKPYNKAQTFMRQGDFENAEIILNKALQQMPNDRDLLRLLTTTYYLERNYNKALETGIKITERPDADVVSYQVLGLVYKAIADYKSCEKLYNKALQQYPQSGLIYCEYGELMKEKDPNRAITLWEQGIQLDPNYTGNYYNASLYYAINNNGIWALIYGEVFINMESLTARTTQIKAMLFDIYKKLFVDFSRPDFNINSNNEKSEFAKSILALLKNQSAIAGSGITPETLTAVRNKFIQDWYTFGYAQRFPFFPFDYIKSLIQKGMFTAYNQWIFGNVANATNYQNWVNTHQKENNDFLNYQRSDVLKLPKGQYYK